jgi:hypothetical protein
MSEEEICCICHELVSLEDEILPCKHIYHHQCIKEWKEIKPFCPLCSYQIEPLKVSQMSPKEFRDTFRMFICICYGLRIYDVFTSLEVLD